MKRHSSPRVSLVIRSVFLLCAFGLLVSNVTVCADEGSGTSTNVSQVAAAAEPKGEASSATPAVAPESVAAAPAEPIVIEYIEADIQNVLRTLAAKAGINLILGDEVTGKVTVHLEGVSYEDAMRLVVESKGYAYVKDKNIVKVKSKESLDTEPVELKVLTLNYAKADDVKKSVDPMLTKQGRIQVDERSNTLIISDTPSSLSRLLPVVQSLDTQTPQVMIEARFIETQKNPHKDLGINWTGTLKDHAVSAGPFTLTKGLAGGPWIPSTALLDAGTARATLSFLNADTDSELLANPRIVTTDNGKAKINITQQVPIPKFSFNEQTAAFVLSGFEYKDIGLILNVTPRINKDEFITLEVAPEASSSSKNVTFQGGGTSFDIPIIDQRQASTTVLIKSGNTLAIGGLMRTDVSDGYTKVPLIGDMPVVGALFRSKKLDKIKRNLLIFLTPTIVHPEDQTGYEKYYSGLPDEQVFTNDKWLPHDNAKQHRLWKGRSNAPASQNFGPK
jgi:type IV pilus assembly protein PilQ